MSTFIKLTNGTTVNTSIIGSVQKYERFTARMLSASLNRQRDPTVETEKAKGIPSIQMLEIQGKETILEFETDEARDAELSRMEAILLGKPESAFESLSLNKSIVQSVHAAWGYQSLKLSIKLGTEEPLVIGIAEDDEVEMEKAKAFLAHFGLELPVSFGDYMKGKYDEKGMRKDKEAF
ncbi:hypothetical protein [Hymenobacter armeniacus]|uniref:CYTH domain-containing protein n=1 Tax=Hymenobacter armeniacus TaxID=2771358 RepID=A0ABR8JPG7_9BACT|nr:hypothetical protein [Hymenobacter armeniacus]MBD2720806.1 hypothetical protein [Hymenobacter armeniacus]